MAELFDNLVGTDQYRFRNSNAKGLGCPKIHYDIENCRLLDWQIVGALAPQKFIGEVRRASINNVQLRPVCDEATGLAKSL